MNSPSESSNVHVVARVLLVVLISALLARFFGKLYAACQSFRTLKKLGMVCSSPSTNPSPVAFPLLCFL
jgi:hypothetical protein